MIVINSENEQSPGKYRERSAETVARLTELMQLLQEIVKIDNLRPKVFHVFTDQAMRKLLKSILEDEDREKVTNCPDNLFPVRDKKANINGIILFFMDFNLFSGSVDDFLCSCLGFNVRNGPNKF